MQILTLAGIMMMDGIKVHDFMKATRNKNTSVKVSSVT